MNFLDIETLASLAGVTRTSKIDNLELRKNLYLLDLQNESLSSVTRDLIVTEVTKINSLINNLKNER